MLVVEKHIKELLFENEYVVVPTFGGFITHYVNAEVNKVKSLISPPSKQIAFNSMLKQNDWLLVSSIVANENVSREEAIKLIDRYVANIMSEINNDRYYNFEEVGVFSLNREFQIYFEPYNKINYLSHSFGLPEVNAKSLRKLPVTLNNVKDRLPEKLGGKTKSDKKLVRFGVYVLSVLVLGCTSTMFLYMNKGNQELSSFNPFYISSSNHILIDSTDLPNPDLLYQKPNVALIEEDTLKDDSLADVAMTAKSQINTSVEIPVEAKTLAIENTKKDKIVESKINSEIVKSNINTDFLTEATGKFYIIVGGFTVKENALAMQKIIKSEGLKSFVIAPNDDNKIYRVTLGQYEKPELAKNKIEGYKSTYGSSIWVLNY